MRGKRARPVREGADGNVPQGNAPAAYFTTSWQKHSRLLKVPQGMRKPAHHRMCERFWIACLYWLSRRGE
ncbi:MAG TPA: hypothetical protein VFU49_08795 [Ktedonobacteraceae bacterium]|nr:hypothetical protein [Ktedonobacteraceae bacterium]